jgi:hypothetical protein
MINVKAPMSPVKIIKGVALASVVVTASSVLQLLHAYHAHGWTFEKRDVYDFLFRIAILGYAGIWLTVLIYQKRIAALLTSIAVFSPIAISVYNMAAIWFEDKDLVLNTWITLCLAAGLILYVRCVWRWWVSKRTLFIVEKA